jgi:hypothetical protein
MTAPAAADLLVELDRLGICATLRGDRISLQPASLLPPGLLAAARDRKSDLSGLLADPRRRWREQAEALVAGYVGEDREDLLHLFDEREAIASIDGGLDDHHAGQMAYETLRSHLQV